MLRYMGQVFVGGAWGPTAGHIAGWVVSVVFGFLLLSAVNTAIVALIGISFLMSRDGELPPQFQRLNEFGVPNLGLIVATVIPAILVLAVKDVSGLADLYAVGVVGAIATNLGACSTDRKLGLALWERNLMFITFLIMAGDRAFPVCRQTLRACLCRHRAASRTPFARPGVRTRDSTEGSGRRRPARGQITAAFHCSRVYGQAK